MPERYDIAVANGRTAKRWTNRKVTWEEFCDDRQSPRRSAETQAEFTAMGKAQQDEAKNGRCFVAGYLEGGRRGSAFIKSRSLLTLDADYADTDLAADWEMIVGAAGCMWPTHSSAPSKLRYRIVAPLSRVVTPDEYVPLSLKVMEYLTLSRFDTTCSQPERLFYDPSRPSDADYELTIFDGEPLDVDAWLGMYEDWRDASCWPVAYADHAKSAKKLGDPSDKPGVIGAFCRCYGITDAISQFLSDVYEPTRKPDRWTYRGGSSYGGLRAYGDALAKSEHATDPANDGHLYNSFDLVRVHLFGEQDKGHEYKNPAQAPSYKSMEKMALELPDVRSEVAKAAVESAMADFNGEPLVDPTADRSWMDGLGFDVEPKTGVLTPSANNIQLIVENDPALTGKIMRDVRTAMPVVVGNVPWREVEGVSQWRDSDDAGIRRYLENAYGIQGRQKIADAVELEADAHPYDPVREYLEGLPAWDGIRRIDTLLVDHLGAEDTPYVREATRKLLCGAVRRALHPGCAFDYMVIIEGKQGMGKSKFLGDLGGEWFTDGVSIADMARPKDAVEKLMGNWICEVAELDGMAKASVESLKAFITTRVDNVRLPYAHRAGTYPRRQVLVGTVNNTNGYLRDASGNRRFWPIKCDGHYELGTLTGDARDQVWAEALEYERAGEKLYLSSGAEAMAETAQREAMEEDPREWIVSAYLDRLVPPNIRELTVQEREDLADFNREPEDGWARRETVCIAEIWHEALGFPNTKATRSEAYAIASMLRKLGWEPSHVIRTKAYGATKSYRRKQNRGGQMQPSVTTK